MMGDWANGEFRLAKLKYGKDYGAMPVPGTKGLYGDRSTASRRREASRTRRTPTDG